MNQTFSAEKLAAINSILEKSDGANITRIDERRTPVHVVYGGAHLFKAETPQKLGKLALKSAELYAPNFADFARAFWLRGADELPETDFIVQNLQVSVGQSKDENSALVFCQTVYERTLDKLRREPIEDFRIDFEDGYGFRTEQEEDSHCLAASDELAKAFREQTITPFCGFRIKSFQRETRRRALRTLDLFLTNLLEKTAGKLPENFVVTLPKITRAEEVGVLAGLLGEFENEYSLAQNSIKIEVMIETPEAAHRMREIVSAGKGRVGSAHFGAYDYTSAFGIVAEHQHLQHDACRLLRQLMQINLAPLGIRLSDSVTTEMPIPVHKGEILTAIQQKENKNAVYKAWRKHFSNVTYSLINGFYQSWDLHPAQLVARYAALYAFFLESKESSARRLQGFLNKASQAMVTGNQFDDVASAQGLLNYFLRALNCGALTQTEVAAITGLTIEELRSGSFGQIMKNRGI